MESEMVLVTQLALASATNAPNIRTKHHRQQGRLPSATRPATERTIDTTFYTDEPSSSNNNNNYNRHDRDETKGSNGTTKETPTNIQSTDSVGMQK